MTALGYLAVRSLWSRRITGFLTVVAIAASVALFSAVLQLRESARDAFAKSVSGTDLIIGARSSPIDLLLYAVFHIGQANAEMSWQSFQRIARHPDVAWAAPLILGDSHRGYAVIGTDGNYFEHFRYGERQPLSFAQGHAFASAADAVLGSEVARQSGYALDREVVIAHGTGAISFAEHADHPFRVVGILAPTGTPVDRTIHVSLEAIEAVHGGSAEPKGVTAALLGLKSKTQLLLMQRAVNAYDGEALSAIMPALVLDQLWRLMGIADKTLEAISGLVLLAGLTGMLAALLTSLGERRREMAVLRSLGASPIWIFGLMTLEAGATGFFGGVLGIGAGRLVLAFGQGVFARSLDIQFALFGDPGRDALIVLGVTLAAFATGAIPALLACRQALADGLTPRL